MSSNKIKPLFAYMGNKAAIADWIVEKIDSVPHTTFVEVFGGLGTITRHKKPSKYDFYNDFNPFLSNLMHVIRTREPEFREEFKKILISEHWYNKFYDYLLSSYDDSYDMEIENALRYMYIMSMSFRGKFDGGFQFDIRGDYNNLIDKKINVIKSYSKRFKKVQILNRSFEKIIKQFDRPDTLLYLDPPYIGTEKYYEKVVGDFGVEKHLVLRDMLKDFKGYFILSYEDDIKLRDMYEGFFFHSKNKHSFGRKTELNDNDTSLKEILITNFDSSMVTSLFGVEEMEIMTDRKNLKEREVKKNG